MRFCTSSAIATAAALGAIGACAHQPRAASGEGGNGGAVTGTVSYRERVALPADALVEISIVDATTR
ncbi:MAG: YbaY family lipoprotein, partial [Gemmatimonadaceae bacterium]|nr:YbaY family lipoprotein [Gemmatimonadaceae bacterium]